MTTSISYYDYKLPKELIAQHPIEPRDSSRLMEVNRNAKTFTDHKFTYISDVLNEGDLVVFNDSRVIPARLYGRIKETGGKVELLLLQNIESNHWTCLTRPAKKFSKGMDFVISKGNREIEGKVVDITSDGTRIVALSNPEMLSSIGHVPLPPYIHETLKDPERYQTVYSKINGSVAAPTAGLHFTSSLLTKLEKQGVNFAFVTLHIGLGTFQPVQVKNISLHKMHSEYWEITRDNIRIINKALLENKRVVAVGTTVVRVLENMSLIYGSAPFPNEFASGWTNLFISPGFEFKIIDAMITNFHLPKSTLLMLISAFADRKLILEAYTQAIARRYRFYSFGDAMIIL